MDESPTCRYDYSKQAFMVRQIQEGMRRNAMYQGTDKQRALMEEYDKEIDLNAEAKEA